MWLCGFVAKWLCGYVAIWLCGYVPMWLSFKVFQISIKVRFSQFYLFEVLAIQKLQTHHDWPVPCNTKTCTGYPNPIASRTICRISAISSALLLILVVIFTIAAEVSATPFALIEVVIAEIADLGVAALLVTILWLTICAYYSPATTRQDCRNAYSKGSFSFASPR